jgi:hypothetical protein
MIVDYVVITTGGTILLLLWVTHRITHPFKCTCGFETHFTGRFKKHVLQGHKWG